MVAAAVAMPPNGRRIPGVRDSKMLSRAQRERLYPLILRRALTVGIGAASVAEIDRLNIYHATTLAMRRAVCRIGDRDHVLIDGLRIRDFELHVGRYTAMVDGDARCYSIAAASVVAKVVRDRLMDRLARRYPHYGWEHNAGYSTRTHRLGISEHGVTPFHRQSFARVRIALFGEQLAFFDPDNVGEGSTGDDDLAPPRGTVALPVLEELERSYDSPRGAGGNCSVTSPAQTPLVSVSTSARLTGEVPCPTRVTISAHAPSQRPLAGSSRPAGGSSTGGGGRRRASSTSSAWIAGSGSWVSRYGFDAPRGRDRRSSRSPPGIGLGCGPRS